MGRTVRNAAKALIIKDDKMLAIKISDNKEEWYIMPGGGQDVEELLPETACREVAEEMAMGAAEMANANCAIAPTGIAGPTGGTEDCPVGTVCFACVVKDQVLTERAIFEGNRMEIRMQAAVYAIEMLCDYIETCYEED